MNYADLVNFIGKDVTITTKKGAIIYGRMVWLHPTCLKMRDGLTFFLDEIASVVDNVS
jgi:hypothetical protein